MDEQAILRKIHNLLGNAIADAERVGSGVDLGRFDVMVEIRMPLEAARVLRTVVSDWFRCREKAAAERYQANKEKAREAAAAFFASVKKRR